MLIFMGMLVFSTLIYFAEFEVSAAVDESAVDSAVDSVAVAQKSDHDLECCYNYHFLNVSTENFVVGQHCCCYCTSYVMGYSGQGYKFVGVLLHGG